MSQNGLIKMHCNEIRREIKYSNQISVDELNMNYRLVEETLVAQRRLLLKKDYIQRMKRANSTYILRI